MKRKAYRWAWTKESGRFSFPETIEVESSEGAIEVTEITEWNNKYSGRQLVDKQPKTITVTYFDNGFFYPQHYYPQALHVSVLGVDDFLKNLDKYNYAPA